MRSRKFALFITLLISSLGWAQVTLTVPNVNGNCTGPDCPPTGTGDQTQQSGTNQANQANQSGQANQNNQGNQDNQANQQAPGYQPPSDWQPGMPAGSQSSATQGGNPTEIIPQEMPEPTSGKLNGNAKPEEKKLAEEQELEKMGEFQRFVFSSTGIKLPIYGESLFKSVPSTFAPIDRSPVPGDYIIGPKDELIIQAWGQIDLQARVIVNRNGEIYLPKVGTVNVAGVHYDQLQTYLKNSIGRLYKNFDLSVNLGRLRSIQVLVVGHAKKPGTYTLGSLSTLVNALFASGGPDKSGSMRHITLKRNNQTLVQLDLYDLLVKGDKTNDVVLESGDVIFVPPVGPQIAVVGSVNEQAIFELRGTTTVGDQIEVAGGLTATADNSRAVLERIVERTARRVEEFPLDQQALAKTLHDGDVLHIFPVSPMFENAITLRGNVAQPGRYPWHEGMKIHDLLPTREAVITREYWLKQDQLVKPVPVWGAPLSDKKTGLGRTPADVNWEYAVIERLNPEDLSTSLIPLNLGQAIADPNSDSNVALQAGDVLTIFSQRDMSVPVEQRTKFIRIEGEVKAAGIYRAQPGETLREIVIRAGGLTPKAYLYASVFTRESTRKDQQQRMEDAADQMERDLSTETAKAGGAATGEESQIIMQQIEYDRQQIAKFRATKATGRIVLGLTPAADAVSDLPPLPLEDGDALVIPPFPDTLQVVGAVYNQNAFIFQSGEALGDYLHKAGGVTRGGDGGHVFVIRADGSVVSKQEHKSIWAGNFNSLKMLAGDTIVVPTKPRTVSTLRALRDWSQVFANFALGAAAIKVLAP
jgi:polysaccharide biosynthesis/export protein